MTRTGTHAVNPLLKKQLQPKAMPYGMRGVRQGLIQAMRGAVASGDAPAANQFYRAVVGPAVAAKLSDGPDQLVHIRGWLANQP